MKENWYKTAKIAENLYKDASLKEWLSMGLMAAVLAVMLGSTIDNAAKKHNVKEQELRNALNNKEIVSRVEEVIEKERQPIQTPPYTDWIPLDENVNQPTKQIQSPQSISNPKPSNKTKQEQQNKLTQEQQRVINILAKTIWAEARGEPIDGQKAVISVILNRAKNNYKNIEPIIKQNKQFSCWNEGTPESGYGPIWNNIINMSTQAVLGNFTPTVTYTHYFNPGKANPYWAYHNNKLIEPHKKIGRHVFLNSKKSPKHKNHR